MDSSRSNDKYRPKPEPTERDKRLNDFKKRLTKFDEKSYGELTDQEAAGKFVLETLKDNQKRKKKLKELNQSKKYKEKVRDEMKEKLHSDLLELLKQKKIHGNKEIFKSPREVLGEQEKRYDKLKKELQVEQQNLYI